MNVKRGDFKFFVNLISPLKDSYGDFSVYVQLSNRNKDKLPLYEIETNEKDQKEVCFMVRGLNETKSNEQYSPLIVNSFIDKITAMKESCQKHIIVLAQKDIDFSESDDDGEKGDYVSFHLPVNEIKTASDDDRKIFYLECLLFDEETEHVHYGNVYNQNSEGIIYRSDQQ